MSSPSRTSREPARAPWRSAPAPTAPRDLVLYPQYVDHFYQQTPLDKARQGLEDAPEVAAPYRPSSLYIRSVLSPTVVAVNIICGSEGASSVDEVMRDRVAAAAKEVMGVWLEKCACGERKVAESDRAVLLKRDNLIMNKIVEIDLAPNLLRLFGGRCGSGCGSNSEGFQNVAAEYIICVYLIPP